MYEAFFGFRERPFDLTPNPRFLLMTPTHREALANLRYGVSARKGITVLVGEAGSGKTTLIWTALEEWKAAGHLVAQLSNPTLTRNEFFEYLASAFSLPAEAAASKARFLEEFTAFVLKRHEKGLSTGLVIDEAQSLSDELLEEVRLLANVETPNEKLFQLLLVGQPELGVRLNQPGLRQIKQRIALRCTLSVLDVREVAAYVAGRIQIAGGSAAHVFTREAIMSIHRHSRGIPRVISVICDNALLAGFAAGVRPVTTAMVEEVCNEFQLAEMKGVGTPFGEAGASAIPSRDAGARAPEPVFDPQAPKPDERAALVTSASESGDVFRNYVATAKRRFSFF